MEDNERKPLNWAVSVDAKTVLQLVVLLTGVVVLFQTIRLGQENNTRQIAAVAEEVTKLREIELRELRKDLQTFQLTTTGEMAEVKTRLLAIEEIIKANRKGD